MQWFLMLLLRGSVTEVSLLDPVSSDIFLGETDITKNKCLHKYIRNLTLTVTLPSARFFRTSLYGDINWKKIWLTGDKFCLNNKVKEVFYKIMHRIYPAKKTLERFKIEYSCNLRGVEEETICHLFYHCMYTRIIWVDIQNYIRRKTKQTIEFEEKDIFVCFEDGSKEKDFFCVCN